MSARVGAGSDGGPVERVSARVGAGSDAVTSTGVPVGFDAEAFWRFGGGLGSGRVGEGNDGGDDATLDDMREGAAMLEEMERTARRVLGGAHLLTTGIDTCLRESRVALRAREETPTGGA